MATGTTVFSRVTVVAPRTRIDVALPADVAVADLLPMVLEMAGETSSDGGVRHGGWSLAKLGDTALDPSRTLASLGVIDGELLQLRKRNENPPPPLYDDVVDAIAEADPNSFQPWTKSIANRVGHIAGGLSLITAAVALLLGGSDNQLVTALLGGVGAIACVALGATLSKAYGATSTGVLIAAAGGLPMAFVSGFYIVPDSTVRPNLLLASALVVVVAAAGVLLLATGLATFIAAAAAGMLGVVAFTVATLVEADAAPIAAGALAVAVAIISFLPRATIQLSKLPLPAVPGTAEELKEEEGFPEYSDIERRTEVAHSYMTGLLVGCGSIAALAAIVAATTPDIWGKLLGIIGTLVLLLRGRSYANGSQAIALLTTGMISAGGILVGWLVTEDPTGRLLWVFGTVLLIGAASLVIGVIFPEQKFSPPMRRTVDILEAVCIATILPIAFAVMGLYAAVRHLDLF